MTPYMQACDDLQAFWLKMSKLPWRRLEFVTVERSGNKGTYKKHTYLTPMDAWDVTLYAKNAVYVEWNGSDGSCIKYSRALGVVTYEGPADKRHKYFN